MVPLIPAMLGALLAAGMCFLLGWIAARAAYSPHVPVRRVEDLSSTPVHVRVRKTNEGVTSTDR